MSIAFGGTPITDIRYGSTVVNEVRRGSTLVWTRGGIVDNFDRDDADTLGSNWTDCGPSKDHKIGITDGMARLILPEGMLGGLFSLRISRARYSAATRSSTDGYVEARAATMGDGASLTSILGYRTNVFHRVDDGGFSDGVGFSLMSGHCWIAKRSGSLDLFHEHGGPFQPGDRIRLTSTGDSHVLTVNGEVTATSTISTGGGHSLGIRCDAGKDFLGPRRFSPALDYVLMA